MRHSRHTRGQLVGKHIQYQSGAGAAGVEALQQIAPGVDGETLGRNPLQETPYLRASNRSM
jgi:hypothetical protein